MEARLVPDAGFPDRVDRDRRPEPRWLLRRLRTLWQLPLSVLKVFGLFGRHRAGAVFSMGGYVAGPVVLAALLRRVPVAVMEPNAIPGLDQSQAGALHCARAGQFRRDVALLSGGRAEVTGVPVRREFFQASAETAMARVFTLLVTGGSQGSRTLNNAAAAAWELFANAGVPIRIIHQAGRGNAERSAGRVPRTVD